MMVFMRYATISDRLLIGSDPDTQGAIGGSRDYPTCHTSMRSKR
jgi:hypothetical protein